MTTMTKTLILSLSFLLAASPGLAIDTNTTSTAITAPGSSADNPSGFVPYVSTGLGYMGPNDTLQTEGTPSNIKLLGSYYFAAPVVADIGVGLMNQKFTQYENTKENISGEVYELAARYQFANRWQAGAIVNSFAGNSDRFASSDSNLTTFVGVQAAKEFTIAKELVLRAGARLMTDVGINNETVNFGMIDLALGWAPTKASVSTQQPEAPVAAVVPVMLPAPTPTAIYEIKSQKLGGYRSGQAAYAKEHAAYMTTLSKIVAQNADLFEKVEVVGHADKIGNHETNRILSNKRAENVASSLVKSGLAKSKIETLAKAETEPLIDSLKPEALKQNRRVELKFYGVKDQAALEKILSQLK